MGRGLSNPELWALTEHCCRNCFGRVLRRYVNGRHQALCAECGLQTEGYPRSLCCCGVKMADGRDAGLRCVPNDHITPETPHRVLVKHVSTLPFDPLKKHEPD